MAKRKVQTKQKKNTSRKKVIVITIVLLLLAGIFAVYFLTTSPKFNIRKIIVKGSKVYTEEQIIEKLKTKVGDNIFLASKDKNLESLKELSYVGDISLDRNLPNVLNVKVIDRKSSFLAYNKETAKYIRLTQDGIIIEELDRAEKQDDELLIFGINFDDNIKSGNKIANLEYKKIQTYETVKAKYDKAKLNKEITSVKFEEDKVELVLEYNLSVVLQEKDLDYKLSLLDDILNEVEGQAGTIDMTKPDPVFTGAIN